MTLDAVVRKTAKFVTGIALGVMLYTGIGLAQNTVSGRIENIPSKSAVKGQIILVDNYDPANIDSVFTDTLGNFQFINKPTSEYTIVFKSDKKYTDTWTNVIIENNTTLNNQLYDSTGINSTHFINNLHVLRNLSGTGIGSPNTLLKRHDTDTFLVFIDTTYLPNGTANLGKYYQCIDSFQTHTPLRFNTTFNTADSNIANIIILPVPNNQMPLPGKSGWTQTYPDPEGRILYAKNWWNVNDLTYDNSMGINRELLQGLGFYSNSSDPNMTLVMNGLGYTGNGFPTDDEFQALTSFYAADNLKDMKGVAYQTSTVGVKDHNLIVRPKSVVLYQNYPNPFNPTTVIRYQLAVNSEVRLTIYNLLGQEVRALVNARQSEGSYSVMWDGKDNRGLAVGSGVYLYRMQTASFTKTMKMILMR